MRNESNKKVRFGLKPTFIAGILLIALLITGTAIFIGGYSFWNSITDRYYENGMNLTRTALSMFDPGELAEYADLVTRYNKGLAGEDEINEVKNSERYQTLHSIIDRIRMNMNANDIYISVFDVDVLKAYSKEDFEAKKWKPVYYIIDSYYDEEKQFNFGDSSRIQPDFRLQAIELWETGVLHNLKVVTNGDFGYILTTTNLYTENGKTVAFLSAEIPMKTIQRDLTYFILTIFAFSVSVTAIIVIIYIIIINKTMIKPIIMIAREAEKFVENNTEVSDKLGKIKSKNEIRMLDSNLLKLEIDIKEYIDNITKITAEKERIGAELNVATQIQADMLPSIFPPFPGRKEFDIYATMTPAKEVGGDFYDFFLIDDDHIAMVMADVSGKGVPAALFMVIAKTLIKNHAQLGEYSPAKVLMQANEQLCEGNEAELFVTVWLAILEISTGKGLAANAGHEHPAIRRKDGKYELVVYRHSPAVATMEGIRFKEHEFELHPGDSLFVYTDGVAEATDASNELYGTDRMLEALNKDPDASPKTILETVKASVDEFVGEAPQFDDITMLGFTYFGPEESK